VAPCSDTLPPGPRPLSAGDRRVHKALWTCLWLFRAMPRQVGFVTLPPPCQWLFAMYPFMSSYPGPLCLMADSRLCGARAFAGKLHDVKRALWTPGDVSPEFEEPSCPGHGPCDPGVSCQHSHSKHSTQEDT
jgi:hypothetical protein